MENAKVMAVEVEQKVAGANAFAEQVGIEKEKVNAENGEGVRARVVLCVLWCALRALAMPCAGPWWEAC